MLPALLIMLTAASAERVYYEDFDDVSTVSGNWFTQAGNRVVDAGDGAHVFSGSCLRGNWRKGFVDPITGVASTSRYSRTDMHLPSFGITDEVFIDYWGYVDPDVHKDGSKGIKWVWFEGTGWDPSDHHEDFNHIIVSRTNAGSQWSSWSINNNNSVGVGGETGIRWFTIDKPGIQELRGELSIDEWFPGRWHHFQVYARLNTPASANNGVVEMWLDGVKVFSVSDFDWRDDDRDMFRLAVSPHMFGGSDPANSFGWQVDEFQIWNGMPETMPSPPPPPPPPACIPTAEICGDGVDQDCDGADAQCEPVGDYDGCLTGDTQWLSQPLASGQSNAFSVEFTATPYESPMDGVVGIAPGDAAGYDDLAAIVRFAPSGYIDARDGDVYTASAAIPYQADVSYQFRLELAVETGRYRAFVTPAGGSEITLAEAYAFRTSQQGVSSLNTVSTRATSGGHVVCDLTIAQAPECTQTDTCPAEEEPDPDQEDEQGGEEQGEGQVEHETEEEQQDPDTDVGDDERSGTVVGSCHEDESGVQHCEIDFSIEGFSCNAVTPTGWFALLLLGGLSRRRGRARRRRRHG